MIAIKADYKENRKTTRKRQIVWWLSYIATVIILWKLSTPLESYIIDSFDINGFATLMIGLLLIMIVNLYLPMKFIHWVYGRLK